MNILKLKQRLLEEGCNPSSYAIGSRGSASDAYCLTHNGQEWQVYYTERGVDGTPEFTSADEGEACEYFFNFMMKFRHAHCVGFFQSETNANAMQEKLQKHGLHPFQDKIPYSGWNDPRFRVFVSGREIFKARELLGKVPVQDQ